MTELSPAALAVLSAYHEKTMGYIEEWGSFKHKRGLIAALEALADQWKTEIQGKPTSEFISGIRNCIGALNEIANELKSQPQ